MAQFSRLTTPLCSNITPFGRPVLLFRNAYTVDRLDNDAGLGLGLQPWALPPDTAA